MRKLNEAERQVTKASGEGLLLAYILNEMADLHNEFGTIHWKHGNQAEFRTELEKAAEAVIPFAS